MKKILFFCSAYPYGHTGPSNNSTVRVMEALVRTGEFEVYNVSYSPHGNGDAQNYKLVEGVKQIMIPYSENNTRHSRLFQRMMAFLRIPIYPLTVSAIINTWRNYKGCRKVLKNENYDILISQFNPFESWAAGALLRKNKYVSKHIVLSWDIIYGKAHHAIIPNAFAIRRQRILLNWLAHYTDKIATIYSQKKYHEQYGDVPAAINKRVYLGIPSVVSPETIKTKDNSDFIKAKCLNFIYAGSIYSESDLEYAVNLLNATTFANQINLILLCKDPSMPLLQKLTTSFKGTIRLSKWITVEALYSLYSQVDVLLSFSGKGSWGVPGKTYEYMSFGKPILHFFKNENDVNIPLFGPYPLFKGINVTKPIYENQLVIEDFINKSKGKHVSFDEVEHLFPYATMTAYINMIKDFVKQ